MIQWIAHRVNSVEGLQRLPPAFGAEIDIRSRGSRLVLAHDPFQEGEDLNAWFSAYAAQARTGLVILNPKEDGLDADILKGLAKHRISHYFFLDLTLPTIVRLATKDQVSSIAVRISEYEPLEAALSFKGLVEWVWLDCFSGAPAASEAVSALRAHFKVCLVSPELQGYPLKQIASFRPLMPLLDAICTKAPEAWQQASSSS